MLWILFCLKVKVVAEEMIQLVKPLCQHEDLRLDPQLPSQKCARM